ncbi:hypothetical protein CHS0354_025775, partial [Potamilus streckersoni]
MDQSSSYLETLVQHDNKSSFPHFNKCRFVISLQSAARRSYLFSDCFEVTISNSGSSASLVSNRLRQSSTAKVKALQ